MKTTTRFALISIVFLALLAGCGNRPGPGPDPCEGSDCPPPPPPDVTLEGFAAVSTVDIVTTSNTLPQFSTNGSTYFVGNVGPTDNAQIFDLDGSLIDSQSLSGNVVDSFNGIFPDADAGNYTVSAVTLEAQGGTLTGKVSQVNNAGELIGNSVIGDSTRHFNSATTASGRKFMVTSVNENVTEIDGSIVLHGKLLLTEVRSDKTLAPPIVIADLPNEFLSQQFSLFIAASGEKILVAENRLDTIAPRTVFLFDIASGLTTRIHAGGNDNEQIQELIGVTDGFLVVMNTGDSTSVRSVRTLKLDGTLLDDVRVMPAGRNLIPIKGGYLSSTFSASTSDSFDIIVQRVDSVGTLKESLAATGGADILEIPLIILADEDHFLVAWRWEQNVGGTFEKHITYTFFARL